MRRLTRNVGQVYTGSQVRSFDRRAVSEFDLPGIRLMHRAGRAAFAALRARWPQQRRIIVFCGTGSNAGDGYVIAGLARDAGFAVRIVQVGDAARLAGDALAARRFAQQRLDAAAPADAEGAVGADEAEGAFPNGGGVVVDALLGTGARGAVRASWAAAIERINASGLPVLAVDAPSGIDADSGALLGAQAVRADLTVTFVAAKLGLVTGAAVDYAGDILVDDLGVPQEVFDRPGIGVLHGAGIERLRRRPGVHKGDCGRLLIVGGEADMGGAVALAGEAALRAGAGLVCIATRGANRAAILARRPELMVRAAENAADIGDLIVRADALAVGPGLGCGDWGRALLDACLAAGKPLVVDADGLNIVAQRGLRLPPGCVLTPHPGEAGRLLGKDARAIEGNRPAAAAALASGGAVAVLKGAGTLVAQGGAVRSVCVDGNPGMATAGSGDVLAGIVGALLARGIEPLPAAQLGVWLHARAADAAVAAGCGATLLAGDIPGALRLAP